MINIIILSYLGGIAISIITSILGNFMVWRKVSYLGDAIGHSSLLGIAIGVIFNELNTVWIFLVCILFSILLVFLKKLYSFTLESLIVFNVQLFLSLGLIILGWFYISNGNTMLSYLFGDILLLSLNDIIYIFILMTIIILYIYKYWRILLLLSINEEIAYSENVKVTLHDIFFMGLLAGSIAILVKFIGVFLIPSLLIIPALTANYIANSPIKCFIYAIIISYFAIIVGIFSSFYIDIPVPPLITLTIVSEFILIILTKKLFACITE